MVLGKPREERMQRGKWSMTNEVSSSRTNTEKIPMNLAIRIPVIT